MDLDDPSMRSIPTRPMRVKILYTFDQDNKVNCLARFPEILQIPAVAIDESNQVGVIELRQCIQAIVSASPELISRLSDGDFTIYAYDYSEYDTPLVGQGMLSAALQDADRKQQDNTMIVGRVCKNTVALFSSGVKETLEVKLKLVPMPKSTRNDFTKDLETIKSLTPAVSAGFDPNAWNASVQHSKAQQAAHDYFNFDDISAGGERDMKLVDDILGLGSVSSGSIGGQHTAGGVGVVETPTEPNLGFNPAFAAYSHSAPGSRAGSPMMGHETSTYSDALRHQSFSGNPTTSVSDQSRPGSRASIRSEVKSSHHQRNASASSQPLSAQSQSEIFYNEDGQARKRAKVMQADWHGRSSFGSKSSNLRVTAATAASMHMHRPIPRKAVVPGSDLEPPPRVPTPVPHMNPALPQQQQAQQPTARGSLLRQASIANSEFMSDNENLSDAIMSSPEENSPNNTVIAEDSPVDMPSSPPVFPEFNQTQPSSPGLPTLPAQRLADSGYMSERGLNIDDSFERDEYLTSTAKDLDFANRHPWNTDRSRPGGKMEGAAHGRNASCTTNKAFPNDMNIRMERPGDMNQLPQKILLNLPSGRREGSQGPRPAVKRPSKTEKPATSPSNDAPYDSLIPSRIESPAPNDIQAQQPTVHHASSQPGTFVPSPAESTKSRRGSLALPPRQFVPSSDLPEAQPTAGPTQKPAAKNRHSLQRSHTSSNDSEAGSPAPSDTEGRPRGPNRSGSGAQRRRIIEQRLQESIAKGKMPTFCTHCGAIETPTWRRLYVKYFDGKPSPLDYQEGEGETIGIQTIDSDESGEITRFVIRKAMKKTKDTQPGQGFEETVVCNPCGLWFNKFRSMRPPEKWNRKVNSRRSRKLRESEAGIATDGIEPQSDMLFTDQMMPEHAIEEADSGGDEQRDDETHVVPNMPSVGRPRANSMQLQQPRRVSSREGWNASQLDAALNRAIQSSPARFHGSQVSPIEIEDLTPKPTRRILFPSPIREGEVKSLDDNGQASLNATSISNKGKLQDRSLSPKPGLEFDHTDVDVFETFTSFNKENFAPAVDFEADDLANLFGGSPSTLFKTPRKTPLKNFVTPKSNKQLVGLLKTPTPGSRKRKPLSPNTNAANNANMNDFMTSPSSSRYFLRSTPSRLERTPGRTSGRNCGGSGNETSPWSRHLAQMLSDANVPEAFTSPSRNYDFSDLPTFTTPGGGLAECDWDSLHGILSSEFPAFDEQDVSCRNGEQTTNSGN